jgi:hypothetical protein
VFDPSIKYVHGSLQKITENFLFNLVECMGCIFGANLTAIGAKLSYRLFLKITLQLWHGFVKGLHDTGTGGVLLHHSAQGIEKCQKSSIQVCTMWLCAQLY